MNYKLVMKKKGYIVVTFKFRRDGKKWTAFCEELGTATLKDVGEINSFFKEFNITFHSHAPKMSDIKISGPFDTNTYVRPYVYPIHKEELNI